MLTTVDLDEDALTGLASRLARIISSPLVVHLRGDLGAGKTTFVRALVQAMGHRGRVKSPTYGLLEHYPLGDRNVLHLDLYRIGDPDELEYLGILDLFDDTTILLVEWPDHGVGALPPPDVEIAFQAGQTDAFNTRRLTFYAHSHSGNELCKIVDSLL